MKKVFIVDDNSLSAHGIARSIHWETLETEVAGIFYDGQSVLKQISLQKPDIIISDIKMPGISGLEMTRQILSCNTNIKIILVSAYSDFQFAQEALRIGAFDYIEKPIDYEYLEQIIDRARLRIDREEYHLESIKRSKPALVENFFYNLTHSFPRDARHYLKDYIPYLGINLDSQFYASIVINIENSEEIKAQFGFEKYFVCQMSLKDDIIAVFQNCALFHVLVKHNRLILIVGMDVASDNEAVHLISGNITNLLEHRAYQILSYNLGIGDIVPDIWHIQQSYENAKLALEYRFFFAQKTVFDIRDCMNKTPLINTWSSADEERLIQLLCKKDIDGLKEYSLWLADTFFGLQDKRRVFVILYSLSNRILKFLYDINMNVPELFTKVTSIYQDMDDYHSCPDICFGLYEICRDICEHLTQSISSYHKQLCKSILAYISRNYGNPDLGLNDLALHVNISNAHLSSIFKNITGLSISDAITNARIDAAQLLLKNTSYSIKEISEKVGYANQYYFSACFKKKTDMTPSGYRSDGIPSFSTCYHNSIS